ncbi:MAG: DUF3313 domain-containing protein [Desulfobacterales bacterium]|nr:MAG: DUF3313 domain-containing protein [Desulfobacterales bacterium]
MKRIILVVTGLMLLVSCASTDTRKTSESAHAKAGFLEGYYEKLGPGPKDGAKLRWLKPGVDFGKYTKVMIDSVIFYLADDSEHKGIDGNEMKDLTDAFNLEFANAFKNKYPIVSEPSPEVLRIRVAITDLRQSKPVASTVSTIIPIGLGVSVVKKGATGSWVGSGATTAEVLAVDSMTNDVVGAAKDIRSAGFTKRFSKWGSAKEAFKFWAERIRTFMDNAQD